MHQGVADVGTTVSYTIPTQADGTSDSDSDADSVSCNGCGDTLDPDRGTYPPVVYQLCPSCFDALDAAKRSEAIDAMCERLDEYEEANGQ